MFFIYIELIIQHTCKSKTPLLSSAFNSSKILLSTPRIKKIKKIKKKERNKNKIKKIKIK